MTSPSPSQPADNASRPRAWLRRVAWCEPFWVFAIGGLLLIPRSLPTLLQPYAGVWRPWLVALLVLGWLIRWAAYREWTRRTPLDWPLFLIILWLPVNYWASADKDLAWEAIGYLVLGIAAYFAFLNWPPAQRRPQIIAWLLLSLGVGLAFLTPLMSAIVATKLFRIQVIERILQQFAAQATGTVNANVAAGALVLTLPLFAAMSIRPDWRSRRWLPVLYGLMAMPVVLALIWTQSRSAYLAAAIGIAVVLLLRWPKLLYVLPPVLLVVALVVVRLGLPMSPDAPTPGSALSGLDSRLELWSRALYALNDFPFTGIGIGTFRSVIPRLYPLFMIAPDVQIGHAHNLLLQVGIDLGMPGLIAFLALLINTFTLLASALRRRAAALDWALAAGAAGGLVAMLVNGIFDAPVWGTRPAFIPWLLVALSVQIGLRTAAHVQEQSGRARSPAIANSA